MVAFQLFDPARKLFNPPVALRLHGVHFLRPGYQPRDLSGAANRVDFSIFKDPGRRASR